jgi:hypothetical protein
VSHRRLVAGDELGGEDDEIAGDVGREQAAKPEEADDVHASCNDAQHKRQQLLAKRIGDQFHVSVPS